MPSDEIWMAFQVVETADEAGERVLYIEVSCLSFAHLSSHSILAPVIDRVPQFIFELTSFVSQLAIP